MNFASRTPTAFAVAVALLAAAATSRAQESSYDALQKIAIIEELVMVPMRDGVGLATNVYRPRNSDSETVPTVFVKTPYNMNKWRDGEHRTGSYGRILEAVRRGRGSQIDGLDGALDKLIESYKCLQLRAETRAVQNESRPLEIETVRREVETLRGENDALRNELCAAQGSLDDMLAEFGNMFGGGKEHELDLHDLKKKLAALQPGSGVDIKPME